MSPPGAAIGPYRVEAELGRGAAGVVYRVRDAEGQAWALKSLTLDDDPRARRRFAREVEALTRLDHPGVVGIREHGQAQGRPYLVMQLVEGETLDRRLRRGGALRPREAAALVHALAGALAHAHAQGVLHRDLKPSNVLVASDGRPVLTDFGLTRDLAAAHHSLTRTGTFMGTPGYWPPELAAGQLEQVGPASDVYGLGAVLYAALTGRPPIRADTLTEIMARTTSVPPEAPSKTQPELSPALERICLRCLEKDPAARYDTAAALEAALAEHLATAASAAGAARWAALAILLLGALGAGAVVALAHAGPRAASPSPATTAPVDVAAELAAATGEREAGELSAALARLDSLVDALAGRGDPADPRLLSAREERALTRAMHGDHPGALADSGLVLEHDDQRALAWRVQATSLMLLGELAQAEASFEHAIGLEPDNAKVWAQRAVIRRTLGRRAEAYADLRRALELDPDVGMVHSLLGSLLFEDGDHAAALPHIEAAIASGAGGALDAANRVASLLALGRAAEAAAGAEELAAAEPENPTAWDLLADAQVARGDSARAVEAMTRSLELVRSARVLRARAECYRDLGDLTAAQLDLDEYVALEPDDATARRLRGDIRQVQEDYEGAVADYARALEGALPEAERAATLNNYALALSWLQRFDETLAVRDELVALHGDWQAHWNRASARLRLGLTEAALADLERSLALGPPPEFRARVLGGIGRARVALGRRGEGMDALRRALAAQPHALNALWVALVAGEPARLNDYLGADPPYGALAEWATGRLSEPALLARCPRDEPLRRLWICKVRAYLGLAAELAGDAEAARRHYQLALETNHVNQLEWSWSRNGLRRLAQ